MEFEWDDRKARSNLQLHGVSFEIAKSLWQDRNAIEIVDDRNDYGEERLIRISMASEDVLLVVVFTEREDRIRIISARRTSVNEQKQYFRQVN